MISQIEEGDTKGGILIPTDKFKEFVEFKGVDMTTPSWEGATFLNLKSKNQGEK